MVRAALTEVSGELARIARAERDRSLPPARIALSGGQKSGRLTGVTPSGSALAATAVQAARNRLLRSVPVSDPRRQHYQRIAAAFDSTAVLLRS